MESGLIHKWMKTYESRNTRCYTFSADSESRTGLRDTISTLIILGLGIAVSLLVLMLEIMTNIIGRDITWITR